MLSTTITASRPIEPFYSKFPYLANIFQMGNVYRSNYNGLQVTLNARNYHGLSMVAGYTYSHALDDVGANWDFGYGSGLPQNAHNPAAEYANSDFDIRHRLTVSLTYAIPGRKGFGQMRGRLGDQLDHHAGKPAVLGADGSRELTQPALGPCR